MTKQTYGALCDLAEQHGVVMTEEVRSFVRAVEQADADRGPHAGLVEALMQACMKLPIGYNINLDVETGWAGVQMIGPGGDGVDYDDGETSLTDQVLAATGDAIDAAGREA
ncbi:hypothetical protein [Ralstonia sp. Ralssp135]|uniref:hypothetical protein n=1 Tax=Ralstonia sp. Ralssp135 TaxID=3243016 RepID=UPI0039B0ABC0